MTEAAGAAGFRFPAEWEPHAATWLAWPHRNDDWPGKFGAIPWVFAEIVRALVPHEAVYLLVNDAAHEQEARAVLGKTLGSMENIRFFHIPTDRGWMRDCGPLCLTRGEACRIVDFGFTGWARYPDHELDNQVAALAAAALDIELSTPSAGNRRFVLEGGAVDVNGAGDLLATEECLLDEQVQPRNPGLSRTETEQALCEHLGVSNILWLGAGIAGDDTHGHIDDLCRFVNPATVVLCREDDPDDVNYATLAENRERLEGLRTASGERLEVIDLPMPRPLVFDSIRLPASYANFLIANETVLVPTFNDAADRTALGILADCFPERSVVGIHAVDLVWGLGTIHCLTQQLPAAALHSGDLP